MAYSIAIGGFQHETNSFAPKGADYQDFVKADGWPALCRSDDLFPNINGVHLPITGAYDFLQEKSVQCLPLLWCSATPSAPVSKHAFETIADMFIEDLQKVKNNIDGVYLDLHGAMICDHLQDGEGELLSRIRKVIGNIPLSISLDLHANISPAMVEHCDYIDIFRTYPHIDMGETGKRAAEALLEILQGKKYYKAFQQSDFIIPLCDGCTLFGPSQEFYDSDLTAVLKTGIKASAACGFPLADIYDMGAAIVAYADSQKQADEAASKLINQMRKRFLGNTSIYYEANDAIVEAQKSLTELGNPIIIADVQDNPGGGGSGDTTGMLRSLINSSVKSAVLASFYDPENAAMLSKHKIGDVVSIDIGGKTFKGDTPYSCEAEILTLGNGNFTGTGPMWKGARMQLGPMALIKIGNVKVILQSINQQAADTSILRHLGVEPTEEDIIVLKSSVHYRADFQPIAKRIISAKAKGAVYADITDLNFKNLRPSLKNAANI